MQFPQLKSLDGRVRLKVGPRRAALALDGARVAGFDVIHEPTLSLARARRLARGDELDATLVAFREASPQARKVLRDAGASYVSAAGEIYVHAPPVHVEVPARSGTRPGAGASLAGDHSPFGLRAARVPRWLLLNRDAKPTFRDLAHAVELSEPTISRTVRALADDGLVRVGVDPRDERRRLVLDERPGRLLDALERASVPRRLRSITLAVGARDAAEAEWIFTRAAKRVRRRYAIGGLLGAERVAPVAQPVAASVWIARADVEAWAEALSGEPARPHPGTITLSVAPDPFVLTMGFEREGVQIADPVQLYLDCRRAGERALEAAEAIRERMEW